MPWKNDTFLKSDPQLCRNWSDMVHEAGFTADLPVYIAWMDANRKKHTNLHMYMIMMWYDLVQGIELCRWRSGLQSMPRSWQLNPEIEKSKKGRNDTTWWITTVHHPVKTQHPNVVPGVLTTPWLTRWYPGDLRFPGERSGCRGTSL